MTNHENRCKARGCENCCWNPFLGMSFGNFALFQEALKQNGIPAQQQTYEGFQMVQALTTNTPGRTAVVFCDNHSQAADVLVQIIRMCPFLVDGNCELIDDPARPTGCEGIVFDGKACQRIRSGGYTYIPLVAIE